MSIHKKLIKIMSEVNAIPKNGYNDFHKYAYVMGTDVFEAMRSLFVANGISMTVSCKSVSRVGDITSIINSYTLTDAETGDSITLDMSGDGQDKNDKGIYKAMTGTTKYFLMTNFLIPTGSDPEDDGSKKRKPQTQAETVAAENRKPFNNDGPANWTWFWTTYKKRFSEADLRARMGKFFECDASDKGNLAEVVTKQSQIMEFIATLPKEMPQARPQPAPGKLV